MTPDLRQMAAELEAMRIACGTGCRSFHERVHDPLLAAERAMKDWLAMREQAQATKGAAA